MNRLRTAARSAVAASLLAWAELSVGACGGRRGVALTFLDLAPSTDPRFVAWRAEVLERFRRESGISVTVVPAPESATRQLAFCQRALASGTGQLDVLGVDVIWPPLLADRLLDLGPYLGRETAEVFPSIVATDTV